ncbi:MAG: zinc ribbon domain-containing protein [Desulfurococcales archaeon]|nr:zinc ribbon domain-containing protein [Desulfurococcales archaeon]
MYERKKAIAQSRGKRDLYERYVARERSRKRDSVNKLVAGLRILLPNIIHFFEDLDKEDLISRKKAKKVRRKRNARTPWRGIHRSVSEGALTAHVDPRNTSRECPRCEYVVETQEGQISECPRYGLKMNRHNAASINIRRRYLEGDRRKSKRTSRRGFPHSNDP